MGIKKRGCPVGQPLMFPECLPITSASQLSMRDMYLNPKKDEVLANNEDSKKDDECQVRRNHCVQVSYF